MLHKVDKWKLTTLIFFATYKFVVVCGSSDAISLSLSPAEVHITVTFNASYRHIQFPASEHKTAALGRLPTPPSSLTSPLSFSCERSFTDVAKITRVSEAKIRTSQNIIYPHLTGSFQLQLWWKGIVPLRVP